MKASFQILLFLLVTRSACSEVIKSEVRMTYWSSIIQNPLLENSQQYRVDAVSEYFYNTAKSLHIEPDKFLPGNLLVTVGYGMETTNSTRSIRVAGSAYVPGYTEGYGAGANFALITGFIQLTSDYVLVVDHGNHCLRLVNRRSTQTSAYLGECQRSGHQDGMKPLFNQPWGVVLDIKNKNRMIVTENGHLRAYNSLTRLVETLSNVSNQLKGIAQEAVTGNMFITAEHCIYRYSYKMQEMTLFSGSTKTGGFNDADLLSARFNTPVGITQINYNELLVADSGNNALRVVDMVKNQTWSICPSTEPGDEPGIFRSCKITTPLSIFLAQDRIYIGTSSSKRPPLGRVIQIVGQMVSQTPENQSPTTPTATKDQTTESSQTTITAIQPSPTVSQSTSTEQPKGSPKIDPCMDSKNHTIQLAMGEEFANFSIGNDNWMFLSPGQHLYYKAEGSAVCREYITVNKAPAVPDVWRCPNVISGIASSATGLGSLALKADDSIQYLDLPIGTYNYKVIRNDGKTCLSYVKIHDYNVKRRLEVFASYNMDCALLSDKMTRSMLKTTAEHSFKQIEEICKNDCGRASGLDPQIACTNSTLTISWPTNVTFSGSISEVPHDLLSRLVSRVRSQFSILQMFVINHQPPVIYPQKNDEGLAVDFILEAFCMNGQSYDQLTDSCQVNAVSDYFALAGEISHIELDKYVPGNLLVTVGYGLQTTNSSRSATVAGFATRSGYLEGYGIGANFALITGFIQLTSDYVLVVDHGNHCLRLVNRGSKMTSAYLGECQKSGHQDGMKPLFNQPWGVILDNKKRFRLIVTENGRLRAYNIISRSVETLSNVSNQLKGIVQEAATGDIFVTAEHCIYKYSYNKKDMILFSGSTKTGGFNDANLLRARFNTPVGIAQISYNELLVADSGNNALRVVDMVNNQTWSICSSTESGYQPGAFTSCKINKPLSILFAKDRIYIGTSISRSMVEWLSRVMQIVGQMVTPTMTTATKYQTPEGSQTTITAIQPSPTVSQSTEQPTGSLKMDMCMNSKNRTIQLAMGEEFANFSIGNDNWMFLGPGHHLYHKVEGSAICREYITVNKAPAVWDCPNMVSGVASSATGLGSLALKADDSIQYLDLPIGTYNYKVIRNDGKTCLAYVKIHDYNVKRRLGVLASYNMVCTLLSDKMTRSMLTTTAEHSFKQIEEICKNDCGRASGLDPQIACTNSTLTISWPTNVTFSGSISEVPHDLLTRLVSRVRSQFSILQMFVINHQPPVIYPQKNDEGLAVDFILEAFCMNGQSYNKLTDSCQ